MAGAKKQFIRFLAVGCVGFLVDAGALYLLIQLGGDAYLMRLVSFALAVSVTWWCNRNWTFRRARDRNTRQEYLSYVAVQTVGACVNYAVYALVLSLIGVTAGKALMALACGSVVALAVNFIGARLFVFRGQAI